MMFSATNLLGGIIYGQTTSLIHTWFVPGYPAIFFPGDLTLQQRDLNPSSGAPASVDGNTCI